MQEQIGQSCCSRNAHQPRAKGNLALRLIYILLRPRRFFKVGQLGFLQPVNSVKTACRCDCLYRPVKGDIRRRQMPSPLGHTALGLAIHELHSRGTSNSSLRKTLILVSLFANLPDIDIIIGLIMHGNGGIFHRGFTHSLLFALVMPILASNAWRCWSRIPKLSYLWCFLLITSHLLADKIFTDTPVPFFWPFGVDRISWNCGWRTLIETVLLADLQHVVIIIGCTLMILFIRLMKHKPFFRLLSHPLRVTAMIKSRR